MGKVKAITEFKRLYFELPYAYNFTFHRKSFSSPKFCYCNTNWLKINQIWLHHNPQTWGWKQKQQIIGNILPKSEHWIRIWEMSIIVLHITLDLLNYLKIEEMINSKHFITELLQRLLLSLSRRIWTTTKWCNFN